MKFNGRDLGGYRFGSVNEETGITSSEFKDADGDGMNDQFQAFARTRGQSGKDFFIDTDGDGIADDRGLGSLHGKGKKLGQEKKK